MVRLQFAIEWEKWKRLWLLNHRTYAQRILKFRYGDKHFYSETWHVLSFHEKAKLKPRSWASRDWQLVHYSRDDIVFLFEKKKNLFEGFTLEITKVCCISQLSGRLLPYSVLIITNDHKVRFGLTKLFFFFWPYFPYVYLDCTSWTYKPTVWLWALNSFGTLVFVFITNVLFPYDYSAIFLQFS